MSFDGIRQCFDGVGGEVLARLGDKTKATIDLYRTGVPTIIFGDSYSSALHSLATDNFTLALCTADAKICRAEVKNNEKKKIVIAF